MSLHQSSAYDEATAHGQLSDDAGAAAPVVLQATDSGAVTVPLGAFLLTADYARVGGDLVLTAPGGDPTVVIRDYFTVDDPPALTTENGAMIDAALAIRLAGGRAPGQYAAAGDGEAAQPVGRVTEVSGDATATRVDGTKVNLTKDTPVFQGDIIETADGAALKVVFTDESTFSVGENGRMVLDEMVFDPSTLQGESTISVLQGVFVFVSGEIAANNPEQMAIKTPVATIGIRGTAVAIYAAQEGEQNKVVLLTEQAPDGQTSTGAVSITNQAGTVVLDQAFETTSVTSAFSAPSASYISPASDVKNIVGQLGDAAPTSLQYLSPSTPSDQNGGPATDAQGEATDAQGEATDAQGEATAEKTDQSAGAPGEGDANGPTAEGEPPADAPMDESMFAEEAGLFEDAALVVDGMLAAEEGKPTPGKAGPLGPDTALENGPQPGLNGLSPLTDPALADAFGAGVGAPTPDGPAPAGSTPSTSFAGVANAGIGEPLGGYAGGSLTGDPKAAGNLTAVNDGTKFSSTSDFDGTNASASGGGKDYFAVDLSGGFASDTFGGFGADGSFGTDFGPAIGTAFGTDFAYSGGKDYFGFDQSDGFASEKFAAFNDFGSFGTAFGTAFGSFDTAFGTDFDSFPFPFAPPKSTTPIPPDPTPPNVTITFGVLTVLGTVNTTSGGTILTSLGNVKDTGFTTASMTFAAQGTFVVGIGVVNEGDDNVDSAILLDDMRLNGSLLDGFETGFTNWATSGSVSTVTSGFGSGPTEGTSQALLLSSSTSAAALESFLGLAPGSLAGIVNGAPGEGSAIFSVVTANAGDVGTFAFNFLDREETQGSESFDDTAFFFSRLSDPDQTLTGSPDPETLTGGSGNDTILALAGNDLLIGGFGDDTLNGGPGDDILRGQGGGDLLVGGAGVDTLSGGTGSDSFRYLNTSEGTAATNGTTGVSVAKTGDQITDFQSGVDNFQFINSAFGFGNSGFTAVNGTTFFSVFGFDGTNASASGGGNDYFVFDPTSFTLYYDDGSNGTGYTVIATVQFGETVVAGDVTVIDTG